MRGWWVIAAVACVGAAQADECDVQTAQVVRATGAVFDHRSPSGENVFLRHPSVREFVMNCRDKGLVGPGHVSLSLPDAYPPNAFFDLVARTGAASLGANPDDVRRAAIACHRKALADREELGEADGRMVHVECQAFRRNGGSTLVSVWPPRRD